MENKTGILPKKVVTRPYKLKPDAPAGKKVSAADDESNLKKVETAIKTGIEQRTKEELVSASKLNNFYEDFGFPSAWKAYYDDGSRKSLVVISMKRKGFPDWDDVFEKAAARVGVTKESVAAYGNDDFWDQLFWDEVGYAVAGVESGLGELVVAGRSGGYWGFEFNEDWFVINADTALDIIKKRDDYLSLVKEAIEDAMPENGEFDYKAAENAADYVLNSVGGSDDLIGALELSVSVDSELEQAENAFNEIADDFESADHWVDIIEANGYYEKDGGDEPGEGEPDEPEKKETKSSQKIVDNLSNLFDE